MLTRYCEVCEAGTPWNKAENFEDSPYMCEGCYVVKPLKELKKTRSEK